MWFRGDFLCVQDNTSLYEAARAADGDVAICYLAMHSRIMTGLGSGGQVNSIGQRFVTMEGVELLL